MNQQFLNLEILDRVCNGNTMAYMQDSKPDYIEEEICHCDQCGFPMESEYEKEIGCHITCRGDK